MDSRDSRQDEIDRLVVQWMASHDLQDASAATAFCDRHPHLLPELQRALDASRSIAIAKSAALQRRGVHSQVSTTVEGVTQPESDGDSFRLQLRGYGDLEMANRGAQGALFKGVQLSTSRRVAIKVLWSGMFASEGERRRFDRECEALAMLNHPFIVRITDKGKTSDGLLYFIMDYVEGQSLDEYLESRPHLRQDPRALMELFRRIAEAVQAANAAGVIHRDLKPSNIRVDEQGNPRVLDFGLARLTGDDDAEASALTQTGQFVGSLPWASPEQANGRLSEVDARSDVYSLGMLLYFMLTATFPFPASGTMAQVLNMILTSPRTPPSRAGAGGASSSSLPAAWIDERLDGLILKAIAPESSRRFTGVGEFLAAIRAYEAGVKGSSQAVPASRPKGWLVIGVIVCAAVAIPVVILNLQETRQPSAFQWSQTSRTPLVGGDGGNEFVDVAAAPNVLIGVRVWTSTLSVSEVICGVQPLYSTPGGIEEGAVHGRKSESAIEVIAPPGSAVSGFRIVYGQRVDGIEVLFTSLESSDRSGVITSKSRWVGGNKGEGERTIGGQGRVAVGIHGRAGMELDAIGLVMVK